MRRKGKGKEKVAVVATEVKEENPLEKFRSDLSEANARHERGISFTSFSLAIFRGSARKAFLYCYKTERTLEGAAVLKQALFDAQKFSTDPVILREDWEQKLRIIFNKTAKRETLNYLRRAAAVLEGA